MDVLVFTEGTIKPHAHPLVAAQVCGPFAYHPTPELDGYLTVTHIPTGLSMGCGYTKRTARRMIAAALKLKGIDWDHTDVAYFTPEPIQNQIAQHLAPLVREQQAKKKPKRAAGLSAHER